MQRVSKIGHRTRMAAIAVAVVAGALAWSTLAAANPAYTVSVKVVPTTVPLHALFKLTAHGNSSNTSLLKVFLNRKKDCAKTARKDASLPGDELKINTTVTGLYSKSRMLHAAHQGQHNACAYLLALPPAHLLRARAATRYAVG